MLNRIRKWIEGPSVPSREAIEIRLEAMGGQGAHSAGKILAEALVVELGWTGHHFSSFGSEKRGTPVTSHIRAFRDRRPVRAAAPVERPNVLAVFHELMLSRHAESWQGVGPTTDVLIHSAVSPQKIRVPREFECRNLATIDAQRWAHLAGCPLNAPLLGALTALLPELPARRLRTVLERYFKDRSPEKLRANLKGFDLGFREVRVRHFRDAQAREVLETIPQPMLGWQTAPVGGAILNPGNSILKDLSASRGSVMPLLDRELCVNCGFCDMVCPDFCFVWSLGQDTGKAAPVLEGIDYHFCKGCQKCVEVCPVSALSAVSNDRARADALRVIRGGR